MKCTCKHEVSCHLYDSELGAYFACKECGCEAYEHDSLNGKDDITEIEF